MLSKWLNPTSKSLRLPSIIYDSKRPQSLTEPYNKLSSLFFITYRSSYVCENWKTAKPTRYTGFIIANGVATWTLSPLYLEHGIRKCCTCCLLHYFSIPQSPPPKWTITYKSSRVWDCLSCLIPRHSYMYNWAATWQNQQSIWVFVERTVILLVLSCRGSIILISQLLLWELLFKNAVHRANISRGIY